MNCAPETLRRTDLGDLKAGDFVNLERPGAREREPSLPSTNMAPESQSTPG